MPEPDRATRRTRPTLLLLAVSVALALGLAEIAMRWLQDVRSRPPRSSDPASWRGLLHRRSSIPLYELTPLVHRLAAKAIQARWGERPAALPATPGETS